MQHSTDNIKLTIEDINNTGEFNHLTDEEKQELISFVYELSLVLYNSCKDEKQ